MAKVTILNTRAIDQEQETCAAFKKQGFNVINFPCIEIANIDNQDDVDVQLQQIDAHDVIIFTSQYAVKYTYKINPQWHITDSVTVITIGTKTAQVLEQHFSGHIWTPKQHNSQGVIDLLQGFNEYNAIKLISAAGGRNAIQYFALYCRVIYSRDYPIK